MKCLGSRAGFALVESLVAAAILSAIVVGGLSLSNYMTSVSNYSDRKNGILYLETVLTERVSDPALCLATIGGNPVTSPALSPIQATIPGLRAGAEMNSDLAMAGQKIIPLKTQINSLNLKNVSPVKNGRLFGNLFLQLQDEKGFNYKESLVTGVIFTVDAAGKIATCHGNSMMDSQSVCSDMGCHFDQTKSPMCGCDPIPPQPCGGTWSYPVTFETNGSVTCKTLTGNCPNSGDYLKGVSLTGGTCGSLPPPAGGGPAPSMPPTNPATPAAPSSPTCNCRVHVSYNQRQNGGASTPQSYDDTSWSTNVTDESQCNENDTTGQGLAFTDYRGQTWYLDESGVDGDANWAESCAYCSATQIFDGSHGNCVAR